MDKQLLIAFNQKFQDFLATYAQLEKNQHVIKGAIPLNTAEVHTLVSIAQNQPINLVGLSKVRGISRSAVTQMVSRLESKGLLIKVPNESNRQEMLLSLTRAGQKIYQAHQKQHAYLEKKVMAVLQAYPQDFLANLEAMMADLEKIWKGLPWLSR
ncbi:MarR family transcriptional regulator [Streptococcus mutans]|nr:MarR family transcriptional regulator [Streptococcus mutans]